MRIVKTYNVCISYRTRVQPSFSQRQQHMSTKRETEMSRSENNRTVEQKQYAVGGVYCRMYIRTEKVIHPKSDTCTQYMLYVVFDSGVLC